MTPFRILIAHSRSFNDPDLLKRKADYFLSNKPVHEVVMVTQTGSLVPGYRKDKVFVADWNSWGKEAPVKAYEEAVIYCDAVLIFWDGESFNEKELIRMCKELPRRHIVVPFKSVKQEIEEAEKKEKKVRKPKVTMPIPDWCKERYCEAHKQWQLVATPEAVKDHGFVKTKMPVIQSATGLQSFLEHYFNWMGHHMERTANTGVMRNGKWTKGSGTNGTTDNKGHFCSTRHTFPIPLYVETKFRKDTVKEQQEKFATKMEKTGAIHAVIKVPDDVMKLYDYLNSL